MPAKRKNKSDKTIRSDAFEREVTTDLDDETPDKPKGLALHTRILIGLAVGVIAGVLVNYSFGGDHPRVVWIIDNLTQPIGQLFLRLLMMIVVPLVFASLVVGVAGIGDIRKLGRIGLKSFGYCLVISAISVVIGLVLANTIRPGERIDPAVKAQLQEKYGSGAQSAAEAQSKAAATAKSDSPLTQAVKTIVPSNIFYSVSGVDVEDPTAAKKTSPNMLHVM